MPKKIMNFFLSWWWCIGWLIITAILVIFFCFMPDIRTRIAAILVSSFALVPLRIILYRGIEWAIDFKSRDPGFKKIFFPLVTYKKVGEDEEVFRNPMFDFVLFVSTRVFTLLIACLFVAMKGFSLLIVESTIHAGWMIFTFMDHPIAIVFDFLINFGFVAIAWWFRSQIFKADGSFYLPNSKKIDWKASWWKILIFMISFYARIILDGIFFQFSVLQIWYFIIFWSIVTLVPHGAFEIWKLTKILKHHDDE